MSVINLVEIETKNLMLCKIDIKEIKKKISKNQTTDTYITL